MTTQRRCRPRWAPPSPTGTCTTCSREGHPSTLAHPCLMMQWMLPQSVQAQQQHNQLVASCHSTCACPSLLCLCLQARGWHQLQLHHARPHRGQLPAGARGCRQAGSSRGHHSLQPAGRAMACTLWGTCFLQTCQRVVAGCCVCHEIMLCVC